MQVISVRNLMLRHKDAVLDVNIGKLEDALKKLINSVGAEGENLAFLAKDNYFTREQHIVIADADGTTIHQMTVQPDLVYSSDTIYFDVPGLKRNPLPENPTDDEIVTWKEVQDVRNELYDRTQYATEERTGVVRLATQEETDAFENDYAVVTPKKLSHLNDRVITLEKKRVYLIKETLPESLLDNTIYVVVDQDEFIYVGFNGVEGEPSFQSVYIQRGSTWAEVKEKVNVPFKAGSTFLHWTINGQPLTDEYIFSDENAVAYAVFADAINKLTFVAFESIPERQEIIVPEGATWAEVKEQVDIPVRTGYGFLEWQVDGETLTDDFIFTNPEVITAIWDSATIPVIFDGQGGIPRTQQIYVAKGARWDSVKRLVQNPSKNNTLFLRWSLDGVSRIPEDYRFNFETRIFALYGTAIEIQVDVQGGIPEQNAVVIPKGSSWYEVKTRFISPLKEDYTFFHWMLNDCEVTDDTFFFEDCTIVAYYEPRLQIDFRGDGGLPELQSIKVDRYSTFGFNKGRIQDPELEGEAFIGWVQRKQVFLDVFFDGYNGVPTQQTLEIRRSTKWKDFKDQAVVPTKENYTFKEWCFAQNLSSIDPEYAIEKDESVRATFTYVLNVDSIDPIIIDEDTPWRDIVNLIPVPTKENFHFVKWQIANEDISEDRIITPLDRIEPYFERNKLIITIDPNLGTSEQTQVEVGQGLTWTDEKDKFLDPTRQYYTFVNWSLDAVNPIDPSYVFTDSITIYALWERVQITLTFSALNSVPETQTIVVGAGSYFKEFKEQVQDPSQSGLFFMFWNSGHGRVIDDTIFEYTQTLNAYFRLAIQLDFDGDIGLPELQEVITYQGSSFENARRYLQDAYVPSQRFLGWGFKKVNCCYPVFTSSVGLPSTQTIEVLKNRTYGEIKDQVQTPVEKYWTFYNWITPENKVLTDDYQHVKTETFRANIVRNQLIVTADDGTKTYDVQIDEGSTWGEVKHLFPDPVLEDYTFTHWALNGKELVDGDILEGQRITIIANFNLTEPSIIVKHPDGTSSRFDFDFGQTWQDIKDSVPVPPLQDFVFDHWTMNGAEIDDDYELKPGDVIVPVYTRNTIEIALELAGGTSSQTSVQVGQGLTFGEERSKFEVPVKEFYTFKYWTCNGYEVQDSFRFKHPETFTAIYERNKFTLTVMSDGNLFKELDVDEGLTFEQIKTMLPTPTKVDYIFTHWSYTQDGAEIPETDVLSSDITIYAVFAYNVCNLVFDLQEGEPQIETFKVFKGTTFGDAKKRIPTVTKFGYLFVGWSLSVGGEVLEDSDVLQDDFITLYAVWNNLIYITFDVENAGIQTQVVPTTVNSKLSEILDQVYSPVKEDYTFIGWALNPGGLPVEDVVFTQDTRLYAIFEYAVSVITFETGDGTKIPSMKVPKGTIFEDIVNEIEVPVSELDGLFKHWALKEGGEAIPNEYSITPDRITFYAVYWGQVAIIFDVNGGTPELDTLIVDYATTLEEVQDMITMPTKKGYFFAGWELDYEPRETALVFDVGEGEPTPEPMSIPDGTTWGEIKDRIETPELTGYTFSHWALEQGGIDPIADSYAFDGELVTIYAVFNINRIVVHFETFGGIPETSDIEVVYGDTWQNIKDYVNDPEKENHRFNHWSLTEDGKPIEDNQIFTTPEVTIYAVYDITHVVLTFNTQGGSAVEQITIEYGRTWGDIRTLVSAPSKTGYSFLFWSLNAQGEEIRDDFTFIASEYTIYSIWLINKFEVSFDTKGGTEVEPLSVDYGTTWKDIKDRLPEVSREGHTFLHWSLTDGGTELSDVYIFTDRAVVYAVYSINQVTISLEVNGGQPSLDPIKVDYGTTWGDIKDTIPSVSKVGHTFMHWSTIDGGAEIEDGFAFVGDMTIWAIFETNILTISVNGSSTQTEIRVRYGTTWGDAKTQLQEPVKVGHTFLHWSLAQDSEEITDEFTFTTDLSIWAVFEINRYTIPIVGNPAQNEVVITYGMTATEVAALITVSGMTGFTFSYWSLEEDGDPLTSNYVFTGSETLYAVWEILMLPITFDTQGGSSLDPIEVQQGKRWSEVSSTVPVPTREGYTFKCWSLSVGGEEISPDYPILGAFTLYAVWEATMVRVNFDTNGGEPVPETQVVQYGTTWAGIKDRVPTPSKAGCTFLGWEIS